MKIKRLWLDKGQTLPIGKGDPKERIDADRDGVEMGVKGDWISLSDGTRHVLLHGSRCRLIEFEP